MSACRRRSFPWVHNTMLEVQERESLLRQVDTGPSLTLVQRRRLCYLLSRAVSLPPREPPGAA
jgi:hypothetical protein